MPLPTDYVDGDVLSASDVNAITTAVNAIDLTTIESDITTLQGDVSTLDGDVTNLETAVGLLTNVSLNNKTANYTLVLGDATKAIEMNVASANTLTIPTNASAAFPVGTQIIVIQTGAGETTLTPAGGVTVNSKADKLKLGGQWAGVTLIKRATDTWVAVGDLA
jgi:hypothetical protein